MKDKSLQKIAVSKRALENRVSANMNAERDYDEWCINLLPNLPFSVNMLDLGCGFGKQINLFANFFNENSKIVGVDKSKESLDTLQQSYNSLPGLDLIHDDFSNYLKSLNANKRYFDLVYSFYALYYADNLEVIIEKVYKILKKGGIFWVVCPYPSTNMEIFSIINKFYNFNQKVTYSIEQFYKDVILASKRVGFRKNKIDIFKNKILFTAKQQLIDYVQNTTFYRKEYGKQIILEIEKHFESSNIFKLTKNIISIKVEK